MLATSKPGLFRYNAFDWITVLGPDQLLYPQWPPLERVEVICTTRSGGVSKGRYAQLNLGLHVGDDEQRVITNRRLVERYVNRKIVWMQQQHGHRVLLLDRPLSDVRADAAITSSKDHACAVMVADCLPVVIAERNGRAVGVAHAGWRGLHAGVLDALIDLFSAKQMPPEGLQAWIGAAISAPHYEVDSNVYRLFKSWGKGALTPSTSKRDHWQLNLPWLAHQRLTSRGVKHVYRSNACTFGDSRFFSYRRQGITGRFAVVAYLH